MHKARFLLLLFSFLTLSANSQIYDPVTWNFGYERKGDNLYELVFTAAIEEGSHIYSMDIPEGGPIPTSFSFDTVPGFSLLGKVFEVKNPEEIFDEAFEMKIKSFSNNAEFRQKITGSSPSFTVSGAVNYMACNNVTCSPPKDVEFEIKISDSNVEQTVTASNTGSPVSSGKGLTGFFLLSMLAGFAGILTPCVFPMIPMTVAFFSQGSKKEQ